MTDIIQDWTSDLRDNFFTKPMKAKHNLEQTGLFSDEALADLIDRHPVEWRDICTMGENREKPNEFRTGDARHLSGAELLQAVKDGLIWINLRRAMNMHDGYNDVMTQMFDDVHEKVPGLKINNPKGGILISSPGTKVPYHSDQTITLLWHVRGIKRLYVYPPKTEFLPEPAYESIILAETTEDVPYSPHFEEEVTVLRLEPGELGIWPLNAPHKVENETFCVSVTTECPTRDSAVKNSIFYANGILRRKFGMEPSYAKSGPINHAVKAAMGIALRKIDFNPVKKEKEDWVTFLVDPKAPKCIKDKAPTIRDF